MGGGSSSGIYKRGFPHVRGDGSKYQEDTLRYLFRVEVNRVPKQRQQVEVDQMVTNRGGDAKASPVVKGQKVGRNDPCPCAAERSIRSVVEDSRSCQLSVTRSKGILLGLGRR